MLGINISSSAFYKSQESVRNFGERIISDKESVLFVLPRKVRLEREYTRISYCLFNLFLLYLHAFITLLLLSF